MIQNRAKSNRKAGSTELFQKIINAHFKLGVQMENRRFKVYGASNKIFVKIVGSDESNNKSDVC